MSGFVPSWNKSLENPMVSLLLNFLGIKMVRSEGKKCQSETMMSRETDRGLK
jgi:hypothetical protein